MNSYIIITQFSESLKFIKLSKNMAVVGILVSIPIRNNKWNMKNTIHGKPHVIQLRRTNTGIVSEVKMQSMMKGK